MAKISSISAYEKELETDKKLVETLKTSYNTDHYVFVVNAIMLVEKTYKGMKGQEKKTKAIALIKIVCDELKVNVDEDLIDKAIEFAFYIINNKNIVNTFKKGWKVCCH